MLCSQPVPLSGSLDLGVGGSCGCDGPLSVQDEQSAVSMLKKHQILEQAVEDYAETVHQLSKTSRALVADSHPERCVPLHQYETDLAVPPGQGFLRESLGSIFKTDPIGLC